jgi:hypothetical protein
VTVDTAFLLGRGMPVRPAPRMLRLDDESPLFEALEPPATRSTSYNIVRREGTEIMCGNVRERIARERRERERFCRKDTDNTDEHSREASMTNKQNLCRQPETKKRENRKIN